MGVSVRHSRTYRLSKVLALNEISDQETDEICGDVGSKEIVLVLRHPIGPCSNL